jgi:hypothetical protein
MPIPKLVLMLVCLMSFTLEPLEPKEASKEDPKEAEVTPLVSKDLADFPGKDGLMITVEYPPGSTDPNIATTHKRLFMFLRAQS